MTGQSEFQILGSGGSLGVPLIGCVCPVCVSTNPDNKRYRSSALLTVNGKKIVIDCGPDYKTQALKYGINHLDGVILTHTHNDHVAGIDEMRAYSFKLKGSVPCLLSATSAEDMRQRYNFLIRPNPLHPNMPTPLGLQVFDGPRGELDFVGVKLRYFAYDQTGMRVDGFRFGDLAYVTDIHTYPESIFEDLQGVKTLVISALRFPASAMHFTVDQAVDFARKVGADKTWLIHISHELDHEKTNAYLPPEIRMAYDGLIIKFRAWI